MEELYINDIRVDLPSKSVNINFQINDLSELENRQSNYSNNISLPFTEHNIRTLDFLSLSGSTSLIPYTKVRVKYVVEGVELIADGIGKLNKSSKYYSLVIYSGNNSLSDLLGNDELSTLDFSAHNHILKKSTFTGSYSNTSGYVYALAKYWEGSNTSQFPITLTTPVFYVHTLWDMIFDSIGKTTSGSFLSTDAFTSRVVSMSKGYDQSFNDILAQIYYKWHSQAVFGILENTGSVATTQEFLMDTITATSSLPHKIDLIGSVDIFSGENVGITIKRNGVLKDTIELDGGDFSESRNIDLLTGDVVNIYIQTTSADYVNDGTFENIINPNFTTELKSNSGWLNVDFSDLIGSTSRINFIKEIMQQFGLIYRETPNSDY